MYTALGSHNNNILFKIMQYSQRIPFISFIAHTLHTYFLSYIYAYIYESK